MEPDTPQIDPGFASLRAHRAELLESMRALAQALAAPATGRASAWERRRASRQHGEKSRCRAHPEQGLDRSPSRHRGRAGSPGARSPR